MYHRTERLKPPDASAIIDKRRRKVPNPEPEFEKRYGQAA
jgi:hypothetical protein